MIRRVWRRLKSITRLTLRQLFSLLTLPVRLTVRAVERTVHFIIAWWTRRDFRFLLKGLPAFLVALAAAYLVVASLARAPSARADQYLLAGQSALSGQSWHPARLYLERAWELHPSGNETLYQLATAASGEGDAARVNVLMQKLAPDEAAVYAPAHLAKATALLQQRANNPEAVRLADRHLQHVHTLEPGNVAAHRFRGGLYFEQGLMQQAIQHLEQIVDARPEVSLSLAKAYLLTGSRQLAELWGRRAQSHFESLTLDDPRSVAARMAWSDATVFLEQFERAAGILQQGITLNDEPRLRESLARVFALWSDALLEVGVQSRPRRFELLSQALLMSPEDLFLFDRMMGLLRESGPDSEARKFLIENLAVGRAVAMSHLLLGTYSYEQADEVEARFHLERAFELSPYAPVIANNFAWVLLHHTPSDPERALGIMQEVVAQHPEDHRFLDTRGQAYIRLKRWKEGIADLEIARPTHATQVKTRQALADAFDALGQAELSAVHRRAAEVLATDPPR
ncbi:MAG: hypothetical protein ACK5Q5_06415 [Planctomycetaceae bacterium]